jgi:hypothetical protein
MTLGVRIFHARRAGCRDALVAGGLSPELAERWCDVWERQAAEQHRERSGRFWEDGQRWIDAQIAARKTPQAFLTGQTL